MGAIDTDSTHGDIEIIDAQVTTDNPRPGDLISPDDVDGLNFRAKGWALKIRELRHNLRLAFGSLGGLTKHQKVTMVGLTITTAGGIIGWLTGTWQHISNLFT